jgi:hypothetical protein
VSETAQLFGFPVRRRGERQWEPWVPEATIARHFSVSTRTVRRWRAEGMPSRMLGSSRRFRISEIESWHASRGDTE